MAEAVAEFLASFSANVFYGAFSYVAIMFGVLAVVVAVNEAYLRVAGGGVAGRSSPSNSGEAQEPAGKRSRAR